jgi:alanyl-tRNA synthetase
MTKRLYYDDSYTRTFEARVVERIEVDGRPAVVLDRTGFYPTGGGQPCDLGTIDGVAVLDVFTRPEDHAVGHVLSGDVSSDIVTCQIDWARRLDHMQHHTGQHILTRAFIDLAGANTVSFHLGSDSVTIDLDTHHVPPEVLEKVEDFANQVVFENRRVSARVVDADEFARINARMRKMPGYLETDGLRVIEIDGLDANACGGTHVAQTGEIGLIKVLKLERSGQETRVEFRCGMRALHDYRLKNAVANRLATDLTVGVWEIEQAVARLRTELKDAHSAQKIAQTRLMEAEADDLLAAASLFDGVRVVRAVFDSRDVAELRALAGRLAGVASTVILLGTSGEKAQLILARSQDLSYDMSVALKNALAVLGSERGGGRPEFAQGGGVPAAAEAVDAALRSAEQSLVNVNM